MTPWWAAVPPAEAMYACSDGRHPVVWEDGALRVPAHGDPEAERALAALGGTVPPCIRLRQAWTRWSGDPAFVTLGRRPGEEGLGFSAESGIAGPSSPSTRLSRGREELRGRRDDFVLLLSLPPPLIDRLVLTAMAAASEQWGDEGFRERHGLRLGAALAARARPALVRSTSAIAAPAEDVVVHCAPAPAGAPASLRAERSAGGLSVVASLPLRWLASVWGTGLSEPDGHLVTELRAVQAERYVGAVVEWVGDGRGRWEGAPRAVALERDAAGVWRVRPDPT